MIQAEYYHPNIRRQVDKFHCNYCQHFNISSKGLGLLPECDHITTPWYKVTVDLFGPWSVKTENFSGESCALTCIDTTTNLVKLVCIDTKSSDAIARKSEQESTYIAQNIECQSSFFHRLYIYVLFLIFCVGTTSKFFFRYVLFVILLWVHFFGTTWNLFVLVGVFLIFGIFNQSTYWNFPSSKNLVEGIFCSNKIFFTVFPPMLEKLHHALIWPHGSFYIVISIC